MGMHHGLFCLGCCWFLMALLFVGGVMNLYWIIGLAIYVAAEKLLPGGQRIARIVGVVLLLWGLAILANL
jgi:predicted metal-binding membrane protein